MIGTLHSASYQVASVILQTVSAYCEAIVALPAVEVLHRDSLVDIYHFPLVDESALTVCVLDASELVGVVTVEAVFVRNDTDLDRCLAVSIECFRDCRGARRLYVGVWSTHGESQLEATAFREEIGIVERHEFMAQ